MQEIRLTLTVEETNQILDALGNLPFKTVYGLIRKIQDQAAKQLNDKGSAVNLPSEKLPIKTDKPEP